MKLKIPKDHFFRHHAKFAFGSSFTKEGDRLLDIGCGSSGFGWTLARHRTISYVGVDRDRDRIAESSERAGKVEVGRSQLEYIHVGDENPDFEDESFDAVTLFDVIEHVDDQKSLLAFIHRVLKTDGGRLVVTCPRKHIFSFFDLGNFKFRFPRLNKWLTIAVKGKDYYQSRFVDCPDGMIGDIEAAKAWHQHFSEDDMGKLLADAGFELVEVDGMGLFGNFITIFQFLTRTRWNRLRRWDERAFAQYQLLVCARKVAQ